MSVRYDTSEVDRWAADIGRASYRVTGEARKVLERGALAIKTETRANVSAHPSWKRLGAAVNYHVRGPLAIDVGYDDVGQGELAGIYEYGSARRAPHPTLAPAVRKEEPNLMREMGRIVPEALR